MNFYSHAGDRYGGCAADGFKGGDETEDIYQRRYGGRDRGCEGRTDESLSR
jgi:hypothetical protein